MPWWSRRRKPQASDNGAVMEPVGIPGFEGTRRRPATASDVNYADPLPNPVRGGQLKGMTMKGATPPKTLPKKPGS